MGEGYDVRGLGGVTVLDQEMREGEGACAHHATAGAMNGPVIRLRVSCVTYVCVCADVRRC